MILKSVLTQAHFRTPEDPKHPHHPITSQLENDKKGRRRMKVPVGSRKHLCGSSWEKKTRAKVLGIGQRVSLKFWNQWQSEKTALELW